MSAPSAVFPRLTTARLNLRPARDEDAAAFAALLALPEITRFSNWPEAPNPAVAAQLVRTMAQQFGKSAGCAWMIEDSASQRLIGGVRYTYIIKDARCGGLAYELHPDYWGRGLMTEALRAVVACGHDVFQLNRIEAWTAPGNDASDRALLRAGLRFEGQLRQRGWFRGAFCDWRMYGRVVGDPLS